MKNTESSESVTDSNTGESIVIKGNVAYVATKHTEAEDSIPEDVDYAEPEDDEDESDESYGYGWGYEEPLDQEEEEEEEDASPEIFKTLHHTTFELVKDPAPEQHSEPGDPMMIYRININDELVTATDEGHTLAQMIEICKAGSAFFDEAAKFLETKKQIGKRCT